MASDQHPPGLRSSHASQGRGAHGRQGFPGPKDFPRPQEPWCLWLVGGSMPKIWVNSSSKIFRKIMENDGNVQNHQLDDHGEVSTATSSYKCTSRWTQRYQISLFWRWQVQGPDPQTQYVFINDMLEKLLFNGWSCNSCGVLRLITETQTHSGLGF